MLISIFSSGSLCTWLHDTLRVPLFRCTFQKIKAFLCTQLTSADLVASWNILRVFKMSNCLWRWIIARCEVKRSNFARLGVADAAIIIAAGLNWRRKLEERSGFWMLWKAKCLSLPILCPDDLCVHSLLRPFIICHLRGDYILYMISIYRYKSIISINIQYIYIYYVALRLWDWLLRIAEPATCKLFCTMDFLCKYIQVRMYIYIYTCR